MLKSCLVALALLAPTAALAATPDYTQETREAVETLQSWYIPATGLYQKPTDWWNTANAMTVLVDYSRVTHSTTYMGAVANTFANANKAYHVTNFVNDANDDEAWWALAWVDAYDLTKDPKYLDMADKIYADLLTQWDTTTCGGGIWWSKDLKHSAYKNAIVNELFLQLAAELANRGTDAKKKAEYLGWAQKEWQWFAASGMINADHLVNDGLNAKDPKACTNNHQQTWSYNQGVILAGLTDLATATHDASLISKAQAIADAAIKNLVTPAGVFEDKLRPGQKPGADMPQFKGVFLRGLVMLNNADPKPRYKAFALTNAKSILANDHGSGPDGAHKFGVYWQGPFDSADGTRQTSAIDVFLAVLEMK
jgi:predicted alpha-1,6-mannanase (GH76 family)